MKNRIYIITGPTAAGKTDISIKRRGEVATLSKYISVLHRADTVEEGYQLLLEKYGNFDYEHRPYLIFSDDK